MRSRSDDTAAILKRLRATAAAILLAAILLAAGAAPPLRAAVPQDCVAAPVVLWGDGRHDDTTALDAWFHGERAIWADSGAPVGANIAGRSFRLSSAIYVPAGTDRSLENFRLLWPERGEVVAGGKIMTGDDPDKEPVTSGIAIVGGDSGEGKPFEVPDPAPATPAPGASCAIS